MNSDRPKRLPIFYRVDFPLGHKALGTSQKKNNWRLSSKWALFCWCHVQERSKVSINEDKQECSIARIISRCLIFKYTMWNRYKINILLKGIIRHSIWC